jgi:leucyl-tRNA synthetase
MGPLDASRPWNTRDVVGMQRFLQRVWRNLVDEDSGQLTVSDAQCPEPLLRALHVAIDGVRRDMDGMRFNTAIAKLIELNNALTKHVEATGSTPRVVAEALAQMLSPLCPHLASELWQRLGRTDEITYAAFPVADPALLVSDTMEIPVQVNGKVRTRLTVPRGASDDELTALALADEAVSKAMAGKPAKNVVVVPQRLVNVVV